MLMTKFFCSKSSQIMSILALSIISLIFSCSTRDDIILTIAVASNAQFALKEIAYEFTKETGIKTQIIVGSSGKHTAQIEAGAPFDIFISADLKFPKTLYNQGLTVEEPEFYAYGTLVLWSFKDNIDLDLKALLASDIDHIAMPNPKTAPYGFAAYEVLTFFGIYDSIKPKLIYGESVTQTNQFIISKAVDIGFTSASSPMAPEMKNKGRWQEIDNKAYSPIGQAAVVLKQSQNLADANKFYLFLFSAKARRILLSYRYKFYELQE